MNTDWEPDLDDPAFVVGYEFVENNEDRADGHTSGPWWYGWFPRIAFWAGIKWERARTKVDTFRETNKRLNRRCQELESVIARKAEAIHWARGEYGRGYKAGVEAADTPRTRELNKRIRQLMDYYELNVDLEATLKALLDRCVAMGYSDAAQWLKDARENSAQEPERIKLKVVNGSHAGTEPIEIVSPPKSRITYPRDDE